jgi:DNA recombination protein RmuC
MNAWQVWLLILLAAGNLLLLAWLLLRQLSGPQNDGGRAELLGVINASSERLERELRREISESSRSGRLELAQNLATFQQTLLKQGGEATRTQNTQIDAFGQQLALLQKTLSDTLTMQLSNLS